MRARAALVAAAVLLASPRTFADGDVETAKRLYDAGRQAHEAGNYVAAITSFEGALRLSPRPSVFFATAQSYRRQYFIDGDPAKLRRAIALYRAYLGEVKQGERRDEAARYLGELELLAAKLPPDAPSASPPAGGAAPGPGPSFLIVYSVKRRAGERASIDDGPLSVLPLSREVSPGKHRVHAEAPGYFPLDTEVLVGEGGQLPVPVALDPRPAQLTVVAPAGARIYVDDRQVGVAPLAGALQLVAGSYQLTIREKGHVPFQEVLTLKNGEQRRISVTLAITTRRKISYVSLIAAGATTTAIVALSFAHGAQSSQLEDLEAKRTSTGLTSAEAREYNRHVTNIDYILFATNLSLVATIVGAGVGGWLFFADDPPVELRPSVIIAPQIGRDQAGASLTWTF